ncbi:MAG TPA: urease accessory UreF family protein [Alphaproteobacteria bacterium]|nr:urease accessory UreF family protein [Alphaproteobacteria bacterium]
MPQLDQSALYRLLAWLSPAYPTGAFSYSHGIEYALEAGLVTGRESLVAWVGHILAEGAGRVDALLFRAAYEAADDAAALDGVAELAAAFRGTAETALESAQQGAAFLAATRAAWPDARLEAFAARLGEGVIALPVAVALACAGRIPLELALAAYLQAFGANLISAGVRLIPLGQSQGQQALAALEPVVARALAAAFATPIEEIGSSAPMVDWTSMRHETQYSRLFRS